MEPSQQTGERRIVLQQHIVPSADEEIRTQIERMTALVETQWHTLVDCNEMACSDARQLNGAMQDEFLRLVQNLAKSEAMRAHSGASG